MIVIGNIGRDPEMTYTPDGLAVTKTAIADNLPKRKGQEQGETQWLNLVLFGKQAETFSTLVKKGSKLYVQGTFHARAFTTKDGTKGMALDLQVEKFQLLDPKSTPGAPTSADDSPGEEFPF